MLLASLRSVDNYARFRHLLKAHLLHWDQGAWWVCFSAMCINLLTYSILHISYFSVKLHLLPNVHYTHVTDRWATTQLTMIWRFSHFRSLAVCSNQEPIGLCDFLLMITCILNFISHRFQDTAPLIATFNHFILIWRSRSRRYLRISSSRRRRRKYDDLKCVQTFNPNS